MISLKQPILQVGKWRLRNEQRPLRPPIDRAAGPQSSPPRHPPAERPLQLPALRSTVIDLCGGATLQTQGHLGTVHSHITEQHQRDSDRKVTRV